VRLDWDAGHGPVTGTINTTCAALAVGWAGHTAHMPPAWAAVAAGAGLLGTHISGRRRELTSATLTLRAAGWLGAGGWCSWAIADGPWTTWGMGTLLAGALGLGAAMVGAHHVEAKADQKKADAIDALRAADLDQKAAAVAKEWEERLARVCPGLLVRIVGVEHWDSGAGYSLDGECAGGTKWRDFLPYQDNLAADAHLDEGCGVTVSAGANRGAVLIDVSTRNALIADAPYPADYSPLTLNGPVPIGVFRDGTVVAPVMRQRSGLTVGRRGSGKTNLMNLKIANQNRMNDHITWVIDLNGGGLALAWLHAWHQAGRPGKPPIDWVADTPDKALAMVQALLRIAKQRKPGYKHLEITANDDKLPVSPQVPGITLNNDEIAELFSPRARRDPVLCKVGDTIVQILEIARAVACNIENAALRATQDVVSEPQILKQSALRIGMKSDEAEMSYLFGWGDKASPDDTPYPGCGFIKVDDEPAKPFKAYRITPQQIAEIVVATADQHPELDELSRRAAGEAYERRWENTDHLFGVGPAPVPAEPAAAPEPPAARRGSGVTADWGTAAPSSNDDVQALLNQADDAKRRLHDAMGETTGRDADLEQQFQDVLREGGALWQPPTPDTTDGKDARRQLVFDIVVKAGPAGIGPAAIIDILTRTNPDLEAPHPDVIARWLTADPRIHKPRHGRYALRPDARPE
jgi:hypothetical protein